MPKKLLLKGETMRSTLKRKSASKVLVTVNASTTEVGEALGKARDVVLNLKKRPLGAKQLGENPEETERNAVATRATRDVAERGIRQAVEEHGLRLSANPKADLDTLVADGEAYTFTVELDVVPEFDLVDYENMTVAVDSNLEVTPEDIDARLELVRGRASHVEKDSNKPISENDIVELSFESYLDGEAYQGSSVQGYSYTMGSRDLPETFEQGLMGLTSGDKKTIEFVVPADYPNQDIAGKRARFDVHVGRVASCTLPSVDDDFAREFGYVSLAAWREKIENELVREKEGDYQLRCEKAVREELGRHLVGSIDDVMIDAHAERMLAAFKADLEQQGIAFDEYCRFLNLSEKSVREGMRDESEALLRENLALESLFRALGFSVSEEDVWATVENMTLSGDMNASGLLSDFSADQRSALQEMTVHRMATEWLMNHVAFANTPSVV